MAFNLGWLLGRYAWRLRRTTRRRRVTSMRVHPLVMAAHELRTPLAGLAAVLDTLMREASSARQLRLVELGRMAETHLRRLLDDVLQPKRGRAERFDLHALCADAHAFWCEAAHGKGLRLDLWLDPAVPTIVRGEPLRLRQVLFNLLANAIRFTDRGHVALRVQPVPDAAPGVLRIEIEDTGIGIPAADQSALFQPFRQAGAAACGAYGGSGLGLLACRRLLRSMGGTIALDSRENEGTRVTVELALAAVDAALPAAAMTLPAEGRSAPAMDTAIAEAALPDRQRALAQGRLILLVEDNPVAREILCLQLARLGHAADAAADVDQALRALRARRYGLVLTDMRMDGLDGTALVQRIRRARLRNLAGRPLPVVALSVDARAPGAGLPISGINEWLTKPVPMDVLARCLARWLPPAGM